ncbi:DMSO/TMAO reductase YedYZ heme-binding membrane subunit [Streptomyces griseochromogenes]|uniref:DMSO/TMAO reductase YedYZ heme-binding membrane subunit n=1 Tax=Streptomyces griseochromogenes TaxID=68214 RepID=A0ABS4LT80_9ACTN|nr:cytochrome b/b6 domain-containing protein [Streptomyces griseochromogenes]MBP2050622.1 DMSO/TMAO reductase YedYZ heme-binding membrane subunit [Streptomyces griseochromogenes]
MNPRRSNSSLPKPGRSAYGVATTVVLLLIPVVVVYGGGWLQDFLNFGAGVLSLVSLTSSVIWGLVTQDRLILNTRQRIVAQAIHRVLAVASIAFLLVHVTIKLALGHTVLIAALIPFGLGVKGSAGLIGLGSLAGLLMIFVGVTGALRNQFASPAPVAARWRAMHMLAYPALCAALIHGLFAGRPAKPFFMVSYELCLLGIMAALALRAAPRPLKRKIADRIVAIIGTEERQAFEDLDASRARRAEASSALPGFEDRRAAGAAFPDATTPPAAAAYDSPAAAEPATGFAAAYRAVSTPGRPQQPFATGQTTRMDLPLDLQATEAMPRVDGPSSTSGSWPIPSPPPVGEAPPSAYDPLQDTGYNIPVYGNSGAGGYGGSDMYDTGETGTLYGTYNSGDTFNSGPATEPSPGASFDAPGSGEPWNMPSGGYR